MDCLGRDRGIEDVQSNRKCDPMLACAVVVIVGRALTGGWESILDRHHVLVIGRDLVTSVANEDTLWYECELEGLVLSAFDRSASRFGLGKRVWCL